MCGEDSQEEEILDRLLSLPKLDTLCIIYTVYILHHILSHFKISSHVEVSRAPSLHSGPGAVEGRGGWDITQISGLCSHPVPPQQSRDPGWAGEVRIIKFTAYLFLVSVTFLFKLTGGRCMRHRTRHSTSTSNTSCEIPEKRARHQQRLCSHHGPCVSSELVQPVQK